MSKVLCVLGLVLVVAGAAGCDPAVPAHTAVVVDGRPLSTHLYDVLLKTSRHELSGGVQPPPIADSTYAAARRRAQETSALGSLVQDGLLEELARSEGLGVTNTEVQAQLAHLRQAAGGPDQLTAYISARGVDQADYITFLRFRMLEGRLEARHPNTFSRLLADALRRAHIQAFVGPCAERHDYPACLGAG